MTIHEWDNDDAGYEDWVVSHPAGFQANMGHPPSARYFRIHRASCSLPDRSLPGSLNPRTGNRYRKVTADTLIELLDWADANIPELGDLDADNYCKVCGPRSG